MESDEEWIARLRRTALEDAEDITPRPAFPVYGLDAPDLGLGVLSSLGHSEDTSDEVTLAYGDPLAQDGPHVSINTALPTGGQGDASGPLRRMLDEEHNRIVDHAGVEDPDAGEPAVLSCTNTAVDGEVLSGPIYREGPVWTARFAVAGVVVTVIARGVEPGELRLTAVQDLRPYLDRRAEWIARLVEAHSRRPVPELPPAQGVEVYRILVTELIDFQARTQQAVLAGRLPRRRVGDGRLYGPMWQRAVRALERGTGVTKEAANRTVTSMVNQLTKLAERAEWFGQDEALRQAAVDETIRYATEGGQVPSQAAQLAWELTWPQGAVEQTQRWLDEWQKWAANR
ncbi:hypothetical protein GCM10010174_15560 [Kutzneria viridogrisea]|uniref:Uncharacterized protein n=2 Tax=Kutzneria TaxID=43356 RepID=W5WHZ4_9PSEU|nr:hypothetical protein [Kutzneria albida]AHI00819.1 hypothetical protein KALB_7461 [Kutzneria albida DSM 43870]MBA8926096.1 hypothetical protein [Kutzneria viridogrisea]